MNKSRTKSGECASSTSLFFFESTSKPPTSFSLHRSSNLNTCEANMMATTTYAAQAANAPNHYNLPQAVPSPPETIYSKHAYKTSHVEQLQSQTPSPTTNISPTSISPISNYSNHKPRQLRQPRQPLYTPAALRPSEKLGRPTDIPGRPRAPDTPPASNESSFSMHSSGSPHAIEFAGEFFQGGQGDRHDIESMRSGLARAASQVIDDELGEVTSAPTTAHWKPDESATGCYICNETFTWFFRRHHCRRCGNLVCDNHIRHTVPLDQNARYHPDGHASKACKSCWDGWKIVKKLHHSRASSIAESSNSSQGTAMPIPNLPNKKLDSLRIGSMARSEGGMVWSTF